MNMRYEILTHLVCNLYDESTVLVEEIYAGNDEQAIQIAREIIERNDWGNNENIRSVRVIKDGVIIAQLKRGVENGL